MKKQKAFFKIYNYCVYLCVLFCLYGLYEVVAAPMGFPDWFHILRNNPIFVTSYDTPDGTRQFVNGGWSESIGIRANGFYSEPSHAAPIIMFLLYHTRYNTKFKVGFAIYLTLILYVFLSYSRTNWLLFFVGTAIFWLPSILKKIFVIIIMIAGLVGLFWFKKNVDQYDLSILERLSSTYIGLQIWSDNLVFGVGVTQLRILLDNLTYGSLSHTKIIHSGIVDILASVGTVGLMFIYVYLFSIMRKQIRKNKSVMMYILVMSFIAHFFYQVLIFSTFYLVLTLIICDVKSRETISVRKNLNL